MKKLASAFKEKLRTDDDSGSDSDDDEVQAGSPWTARCLQKPPSQSTYDASSCTHRLTYSAHTQLAAPLKGWMTYSENTNGSHPFSLEFKYFSMNEVCYLKLVLEKK